MNFFLVLSCFFLHNYVAGKPFEGQIANVLSYANMQDRPFLIGVPPNDEWLPISGYGGYFTPGGFLQATINPLVFFRYIPILIPDDGEIHIQVKTNYSSSGLLNGPSGNPAEGFFLSGAIYFGGNSGIFTWILTDLMAYAFFSTNGVLESDTYAIPLSHRQPSDTDIYTVVIDRKNFQIKWIKNNKALLILSASMSVDPKFRVSNVPIKAPTPIFTKETFPIQLLAIISLGPLFLLENNLTRFCQNALFNNCIDEPMWAPHCCCQYLSNDPIPPTANFTAQMQSVEIFEMKKTEKCPGRCSDSGFVPWWHMPVKQEDELLEALL